MASRGQSDDNEPQEDDELTAEHIDMDLENKMNVSRNGLAPSERPTRVHLKYDKFLTNRHYQLHALFLLIILVLGLVLISIGIKVLVYSLRSRDVICENSDCLFSAARISASFNRSINPCDDFYQFACQKWINSHLLNNDQAHYSVKEDIKNKVYLEIKHYLDKILSTSPPNDPHFKAKQFYQTCMNLEDIDFTSLNYFSHEVANAGGWNIIGNWHGPSWQHDQALQRLQTIYGVNAFFKITVGADDMDPILPFIIKIFPSGLGLPSRNYYYDPEYKHVVDSYKQYMSEAVKIFGGTNLDSSQFAENTFNYEKRIAEITPDYVDYAKPAQMYKRRSSIVELKTIAPSIKWLSILQNYFQKARINDNTRVLLAFEPYFRNISNIISTTDSKGLNDYLIWKMISTYAPYLSKEFRLIHNNFQQALNGLQTFNMLDDENRWKFCLDTTSKFFGFSLASVYVKNKISEISNATSKARLDIVDSIRNTILKHPNLFIWNKNENARKLINMKTKRMQTFVGLPQFVLKPNLANYYNEYLSGVKFLQNIIEAIDHRHKKMEMMLNIEKNYDYAWPVLPYDTDLTYDYAGNSLFIPFGMLREPFYSFVELNVQQYGALGFHVASQMLRAFDLKGLYYGLPDGRLEDNREFIDDDDLNQGLVCLKDNLNHYSLKTNNTVSQTYIDLGALKIAWLAYKNFEAQHKESVLPSIRLTNDQLFFVSFAQSMCSNTRPESLWMFYERNNQLPDWIRVNTLLSQSQTFAHAFQCREPVSQVCNLWN